MAKSKIVYTSELVTPAKAREWLGTKHVNRSIVRSAVDYIKAQIVRGLWRDTGEPILFDSAGHLIDGQHRLTALAEHGGALTLQIGRGVDPEAFWAIDTGRSRKGSDTLSAMGHSQQELLAAVLRLVVQDDLGVLGSEQAEHRATNEDIALACKEHPEIARDLLRVFRDTDAQPAKRAAIVFLYWKTHQVNPLVASAFWPGVLSGAGLSRGTPPFLLRKLLTEQRSKGTKRLIGRNLLACAIKAWNYALIGEGMSVSALVYRGGMELFPAIAKTRTDAAAIHKDALRASKQRAKVA